MDNGISLHANFQNNNNKILCKYFDVNILADGLAKFKSKIPFNIKNWLIVENKK